MSRWFEDLEIGETDELGTHTFTADEIKTFARQYDPQPFHLDEEAARRSAFGALCASGWHTAAIWMRLMVRRRQDEETAAAGARSARLGPSPGFRDMKWLKPVYVDDTIDYRSEVLDKRTSNSRPRFGLMTVRSTGINQHGEPVISFVSTTFVERRPVQP